MGLFYAGLERYPLRISLLSCRKGGPCPQCLRLFADSLALEMRIVPSAYCALFLRAHLHSPLCRWVFFFSS